MYSLLVGIDISKDFFATAGINSEGKESFSRTSFTGSSGSEGSFSGEGIALSFNFSHPGRDQEGLKDDLPGARIHRESLHRRDASFSRAVSVGTFGKRGKTEGHRKGFEGALCGGQTYVLCGGYPSGSQNLDRDAEPGERDYSSGEDCHLVASARKAG